MSPACLAAALGLALALAGCAERPIDAPDVPVQALPVDDAASCPALAASFDEAASRAAALEFWSAHPVPGSYGYGRFDREAGPELIRERARLDAINDIRQGKGCTVESPMEAVSRHLALLRARQAGGRAVPPLAPPPPVMGAPLPPAFAGRGAS